MGYPEAKQVLDRYRRRKESRPRRIASLLVKLAKSFHPGLIP